MSKTMVLGVIILNWNAATDTTACLRSIQAWRQLTVQVWVVDNASQDDSVARIEREFPGVHLIQSAVNRGFAGGNNLALSEALEAECQEVLLLNNDANVEEDDVVVLLETLRSHPELGIVGPTIWDSDHPQVLLSAGGTDMARNLVSHIREVSPNGQLRSVEYVPGVCVLIRAEVLRRVGLLDEDYFFGGELADLCARARQQGFTSAVDERTRAYHRVNRSSELRENLHIYYVLRNRFLFVRKFHSRERWFLFPRWVAYGAYLAILSAVYHKYQRTGSILLGLLDGLRGRFGGQNERVLGVTSRGRGQS